MGFFKSAIATATIASIAAITTGIAPANADFPKIEKVYGAEKLFRSHTYTGGRFTRRMAADAGYPDAVIIDRRARFGDTYSCSVQRFKRHQIAIICD